MTDLATIYAGALFYADPVAALRRPLAEEVAGANTRGGPTRPRSSFSWAILTGRVDSRPGAPETFRPEEGQRRPAGRGHQHREAAGVLRLQRRAD
jgi:hypothetical protein